GVDSGEQERGCGVAMTTREALLKHVSEKEFMQSVIDFARALRWRVYHTHDSRRSEPGFPDLFMVRGTRAIAAELKRVEGQVTPAQRDWLQAINATGIETYIWKPIHWDEIKAVLS